jgi:hypothetical protein
LEATISCEDNGLFLGEFDKFVDTIVAIRAPAIGGENIRLIAKSHRAKVIRTGEKFRNLPTLTKERFIDRLVELFSWDLTAERASNLWNEILDLEEVGEILRALDSELKTFDPSQRMAIAKESTDLAIEELGAIERNIERCIVEDDAKLSEDLLVAVQTIYLCRLALAWVSTHIEKKGSVDIRAVRVQLGVLVSLARLASYARRRVALYLLYDDLAVLSHVLMDEDAETLLGIVEDREHEGD